jgi:hypothetical protein
MAKTTTDEKTVELMREVARRKAEIKAADRPQWVTNCNFSYQEGSANIINLHVESDVRKLVLIVAFLKEKERGFAEAAKELGVEGVSFSWNGFPAADWIGDVKMRITKLQIATKRKKLETLEARLNGIISPELRAKMELEAIENELT